MLGLATGNAMLWPGSPVRIRHAKYYEVPPALFERWTPISRITVHDPADLKITRPDSGFGWSLSPKYKGAPPPELWIEQDAAAGTPITGWDGASTATVDHLLHDLTAVLHRIRTPRTMFIIGPGGGRDVLAALAAGVRRVTAVEMNPATVDLMKWDLADFSGNLYNDPRVEVIVGEGRSVLRAGGAAYDAIQVSLIDSLAATATGALVFVENTLYTREAFETYLAHLEPDGVLTMSWWYLGKPPGVAYRVLLAAAEALRAAGVADPVPHILLVRSGPLFNVMVKRSAWTPAEVAAARAECETLGFQILLGPGVPAPEPEVAELLRDPAAVLARHDLNLRAATDDSPFIFQLQKWGADYSATHPENLVFLAGTRILGPLLALMAAAGLVLVILPLVHRAARARPGGAARRQPWVAAMVGSAGCGLGYIIVEITLMHYGTLFVGYPVYSLLLVLVAMLLGSGIGSAWTARYPVRRLCLCLAPAMVGLGALLYLVTIGAHALFGPSAHWSWAGRAALICGTSLVLGAVMGMPFPTLMRAAGGDDGHAESAGLLPWLWGVNGVAGVLASVLIMYIAVFLGHTAAMLAGSACYVAVGASLWWLGIRGEPAVQAEP
jgi:spermidine synthase